MLFNEVWLAASFMKKLKDIPWRFKKKKNCSEHNLEAGHQQLSV